MKRCALLLVAALAVFPSALSAQERATILFGGDVMLSRRIGAIIAERDDPFHHFRLVADELRAADLAVVNLENPISDGGVDQGQRYAFRAEPRTVEGLVAASIDLVTVANNHAFDYGPEAAFDTLEILAANGIDAVGLGPTREEAYAAVIREVADTRIAFLGVTAWPAVYNPRAYAAPVLAIARRDVTLAAIERAALQADLVVVLIHWGYEYQTIEAPEQRALGRAMIDAGADLVIGHHPHVPQPIEEYGDGYIVYSLGNFVFDQNRDEDTRRGLLFEATVGEGRLIGGRGIPIRFTDTYQPYIVERW